MSYRERSSKVSLGALWLFVMTHQVLTSNSAVASPVQSISPDSSAAEVDVEVCDIAAEATTQTTATTGMKSVSPDKHRRTFKDFLFGSQDPEEQEEFIYKTNSYKAVLQLGGPPTISYVASGIMLVVDRTLIGHFSGPSSLAALSYASGIDPFVKAIGSFTSIGGSSYISIELGSHDYEAAEKTLGLCWFLNFVLSVLILVILCPLVPQYLIFTGSPEQYLSEATHYAYPLVGGCLFVITELSLSGLLQAEGRANLGSAMTIAMTLLNTIFGLILVGGCKLGLLGAAFASIISAFIVCILETLVYACHKSTLRLRLRNMIPLTRADWVKMGHIMLIGIGDVLGALSVFVVLVVSTIVTTSILESTSDISPELFEATVNGVSSAFSVSGVFEQLFLGVCSTGLLPMLGFAIGHKDYKRYWEVMRADAVVSTILSLLIVVFIHTLAPWIVQIFYSGEPYETIATQLLRRGTGGLFGASSQFFMITAAQSLKMGVTSCIFSFISFVVLFPLGFAVFGFGFHSVKEASLGFTVAYFAASLLCIGVLLPIVLHRSRRVLKAPGVIELAPIRVDASESSA